MFEFTTQFTPADGSPPRTITICIGDVRAETDGSWTAAMEILGFKHPDRTRSRGVDALQAIELATVYIARMVASKVAFAGGGMLDPPLYAWAGEF